MKAYFGVGPDGPDLKTIRATQAEVRFVLAGIAACGWADVEANGCRIVEISIRQLAPVPIPIGTPRNEKEKRVLRATERLKHSPEWSDRKVAREAKISPTTVGRLRRTVVEMEPEKPVDWMGQPGRVS